MKPHSLPRPRVWIIAAICALLVINGTQLLLEQRSTPWDRAVMVIAAESAGEGFGAMVAVGEVLRTRGSFEGFSVMSKDLPAFFAAESRNTRLRSHAAWLVSRLRLLSGGATHFENVALFGRPAWARGMTLTARWGGVEFYRKSNKYDYLIGKYKI